MTRRIAPLMFLLALATVIVYGREHRGAAHTSAKTQPFTVVEATIPEMQAAMTQRRVTSRELVQQYLVRIGLYEDKLHAAIAINPKALEEADALDRERAQGRVRGPLHGIPI